MRCRSSEFRRQPMLLNLGGHQADRFPFSPVQEQTSFMEPCLTILEMTLWMQAIGSTALSSLACKRPRNVRTISVEHSQALFSRIGFSFSSLTKAFDSGCHNLRLQRFRTFLRGKAQPLQCSP